VAMDNHSTIPSVTPTFETPVEFLTMEDIDPNPGIVTTDLDMIPIGRILGGIAKGIEGLFKGAGGVKVVKGSNTLKKLTQKQEANLKRFNKKLPKGAKTTTVDTLPNGDKVFKAEVPGKVPGSKAIYEKTIDVAGNTVKYIKTTHTPNGSIAHVKQKYP